MDMKAFMLEKRETIAEVVISERMLDVEGNPIPWQIRVLTQAEMQAINKLCVKKHIDPKSRQQQTITDTEKLYATLIEECVLYPNLNDAELQDFYGAVGAAQTAENMLLPGEYTNLLEAISGAQGFESDLKDKIKIVKN